MIYHPHYPLGNVYLSGGMNSANQLGKAWRQAESKELKKLGFFPLDITDLDGAYSAAHTNIFANHQDPAANDLQFKSDVRKHFIDADIKLIRNDTDAVLILYDEHVRTGAGSLSECYEAFTLDMPVFLVNDFNDVREVPGWLQAECTKIFPSFNDFHKYLGALPDRILKRDQYGNRHVNGQYLCSLCGTVEEKHGAHFVSKISPVYCKQCVEIVKTTFEKNKDRYEFFIEELQREIADAS
jgi:hypothetical protein